MKNNNEEERLRKMAQAARQKKYDEKCVKISVKYVLSEQKESDALAAAVQDAGLSNNAYIKQAVREKLARDGYLTECGKGENE